MNLDTWEGTNGGIESNMNAFKHGLAVPIVWGLLCASKSGPEVALALTKPPGGRRPRVGQ